MLFKRTHTVFACRFRDGVEGPLIWYQNSRQRVAERLSAGTERDAVSSSFDPGPFSRRKNPFGHKEKRETVAARLTEYKIVWYIRIFILTSTGWCTIRVAQPIPSLFPTVWSYWGPSRGCWTSSPLLRVQSKSSLTSWTQPHRPVYKTELLTQSSILHHDMSSVSLLFPTSPCSKVQSMSAAVALQNLSLTMCISSNARIWFSNFGSQACIRICQEDN